MSEERREEHIRDALAHAMIPPAEQPMESRHPEEPPREDEAPDTPSSHVGLTVESGPMVDQLERLFPLVWLGMLTVVSVVGIYNAVRNLPDPTPFF